MVEYYSNLVYLEVLISHRAPDESALRSDCGDNSVIDLHRASIKSLFGFSFVLP